VEGRDARDGRGLLAGVLAGLAALAVAAALLPVRPAAGEPGGVGPAGAHGAGAHGAAPGGDWQPTRFDTCPKALHDRYRVRGPDGRWYPTWHPPTVIDPATGRRCTFGHEHGRNPRNSQLWPWIRDLQGGIPFGYANAMLDEWNAARGITGAMRHEDHVGHKIEWQNDVRLHVSVDGRRVPIEPPVICDVLGKLHQGTHSPDALAMNLHELAWFARCTDGTEMALTVLSAIGAPGSFHRSCGRGVEVVVDRTPPPPVVRGRGMRFIPDRTCVERHILVPAGQFSQFSLGLYEDWLTANYLRTADGRQLAYWDPHFAVFNPARYHDPARPGGLGRTVTACWERLGERRARGGPCDGVPPGLAWDHPASPFNGAHREMYVNQLWITNRGGPRVWYSDPFGGRASRRPFPGAIRQVIAPIDTTRPWPLESQAFGATRPYDRPGSGVHAPN
jgi:hypothetical protein